LFQRPNIAGRYALEITSTCAMVPTRLEYSCVDGRGGDYRKALTMVDKQTKPETHSVAPQKKKIEGRKKPGPAKEKVSGGGLYSFQKKTRRSARTKKY